MTRHDSRQPDSGNQCDEQGFSAELLKLLFDQLGIPVQTGAVAKACDQASQSDTAVSPVEHLTLILKTLQLKGVQVAQLRWDRMDQRRLPALVFHESQWHLVEQGEDGLLLLTSAKDERENSRVDSNVLGQSPVLWLRTVPRPAEESTFYHKDNIAARLVLEAMFKSRSWLREVAIASLIVNVLAVATSLFAMQVYDRVVPTLAYATLHTLVVGMILIITLTWLLRTLRARILDSVSCKVDKEVSQRVFEHIIGLQLDTRPRSLGTLAAQVGGLDSVRQFFSSSVVFALVDLPFALLFIGFIALIGGAIAWVYVTLLPIALILGWMTQKRLRSLMQQQMMRANERQGLLVDTIQGAESIRSNNASWRFCEQWREITSTIARYNIQQKAISNRATITTAALASLAFVSAIVVGVGQIDTGNLTMGALIACSILGGRVIAPVAQSVQYLAMWQNVKQALSMVNQVLILDAERRPGQQLLMPDQVPDRISLEHIRFSYPSSPVRQLHTDSLIFNSGDRVAVLGPVGCGKSTLLKVLAGHYRPSAGRIRLGNADLWEIDPTLVAEHVSYLPQTVHLFKGTLRSNLTLSGAVSDTRLLEVCQSLGINEIAENSALGLDLEISEGGEGLSTGQRQLVGLSRVFLAQPRIWLLDEPTSSLDPVSERKVLEALRSSVGADDILIFTTHRPALASQLANRTIVMQQGRIIEDGQTETILAKLMASPKPPSRQNNSSTPSFPNRNNKGLPNVI